MEPDAYITDLEGEILVSREGADHGIHVGTVSAHSVHLGEADEDGVSWFDVLDARDGGTAMYTDLIDVDGSCYSEWVESNLDPFGNDLLILDRIRIAPEYRGNGYGLYAAQLMITSFACSGVLACVPAPYELLENTQPREPDARSTNRGKRIPGWTAAETKLRTHWSLLGFEQVPNSDVFALSVTARRPSMETVIRKYLAGKHKRRFKVQIDA